MHEKVKKFLSFLMCGILSLSVVGCTTGESQSTCECHSTCISSSSVMEEIYSSEEFSESCSDCSDESSDTCSDSSYESSVDYNDSSYEDSSSEIEPPIDSTGVVPYDGSAVTVTFYHTMGAVLRDVLDRYISQFNTMYPNITINHKTLGDYVGVRDQITTELTAGRSPSIAYCYSDHVALYNKADAVFTLDDYIASDATVTRADGTTEIMGFTDEQLADFIPSFYEEGRVYGDNLMYTLPYSKSTEVLYYNKTYFEQKGYEVPTTWDEMEALCAKIKAEEPNNIPLGYDTEANWFITMCEQMGIPYTSVKEGDHFLFNTPEHVEFVTKFSDWYDKGYVTTKELYGSYTSDLFTMMEEGKQRSYMCIGSSAGASYQCPALVTDPTTGESYYPFEVGVAQIPQVNPAKPKVVLQGPSLVLFKKSAQEQAATWLFAKFLTTTLALQAEFSMASGYTPVIKSVQQDPPYSEFLNDADGNEHLPALVVKQALAQADAHYVSPAFVGSVAARDAVGSLMVNCFAKQDIGSMSVAEFIQKQFDDTVAELAFRYN